MPAQGLQFIQLRIPPRWDPVWFEQFVRDVLSKADVRNAIEGPGVTIEGTSAERPIITATADLLDLLEQNFILATSSSFLARERVLDGEDDVVTATDEGPGGRFIIGIKTNGIGPSKFRRSVALSVVGRRQDTDGNVNDIAAADDNTFLVRRGNVLTFDGLADADIPADIARDTEVVAAASAAQAAAEATAAAALAAHVADPDPHPDYLTEAEADAAYQPVSAALAHVYRGTGSPEGVLAASIGAFYQRADGGAGTSFYVKEADDGANTGWVAK